MALFVISALPLRTGRRYISGMPLRVAGGQGYLAGEFPGGATTVGGAPVTAEVRALWRDLNGTSADGVVVAKTQSAPDGTWILTGLNPALKYDVVGRKAGFNDVIVSNVMPTSMVDITYAGAVVENETFTGAEGYVEVIGGIPPYSVTVETPFPPGLFPIIDGHKLIIDGTTGADEVASFDVKVTSSNGAEKIIPLQLVVGFKAPQNLASEVIFGGGVFSVVLTWETTNSTQQVKVYRSETPFDMDDLPEPIATLSGASTTYTDDDVIKDDVFYYMAASVCESYTLYSDGDREVVISGDPHWDKVVSLLHFDGGFADETGRLWTQTGEFLTSADNKVFGAESAYFPPTGLRGLQTPSTLDLNLGSDDFTVECWINPRIRSRQINICGLYGYSFDRRSWDFLFERGYLRFRFSSNGRTPSTFVAEAAMGSGMLNRWTHIAVAREGNVFRMFFDGVVVSQAAHNISALENLVDPFVFGTSGPNFVNSWDGYIDELRITKGVARYTENFTPPTEPFPNF